MIGSMTSARERIGRLDVAIALVATLLAAGYMLSRHRRWGRPRAALRARRSRTLAASLPRRVAQPVD